MNPIVTLKIKDKGEIKIELYKDIVPNTVKNFVSLVKKGFYDNLIFHRVIDGFMIQGGDPQGTGYGGADYTIKGEFALNRVENPIKHKAGVISMARSNYPDSASSQFFIMLEDIASLDGQYAAFGKVIEGMEIVKEIGKTKTNSNDCPLVKQIIEKATVDMFGEEIGEPEIIK